MKRRHTQPELDSTSGPASDPDDSEAELVEPGTASPARRGSRPQSHEDDPESLDDPSIGWNAWMYRHFSAESRLANRGERAAGPTWRSKRRDRSGGNAQDDGASTPPATAQERSDTARRAVNGLQPVERRVGIFAIIAELALTALVVAPYLAHSHKASTSTLKTTSAVHIFLIEGLVLGGFLILGTLLKRRALLGFASLLVGVWLVQIKALALLGFAYFGFGLWLVVRALKFSNPNREAKTSSSTGATASAGGRRTASGGSPRSGRRGSKSDSGSGRGSPKPSKRYTPPKPSARAGASKWRAPSPADAPKQ